jgi:uncharacterized protein YjbI with pentapeptide repeats
MPIYPSFNLQGLRFTDKTLIGEDFQNVLCGLSLRSNLIFSSILLIVHILIGAGFQLCETSILQGLGESFPKLGIVLLVFSISLISIFFRGFLVASFSTIFSAFVILVTSIVFGGKGNIGSEFAVGSLIGIINFFIFAVSIGILAISMTAGFIIGGRVFLIGLGIISIASAVVVSVLDSLLGIPISLSAKIGSVSIVWLTTVAAGCIAQRTISENYLFSQIRSTAVAFVALWGTNFRRANLTEANFSNATLRSVDFRRSILKRTYWRNAKGLKFARLGNTYLANPKIRQLVVTCNGQGEIFDGLDLNGVNLQEANLQEASFIGVSLNQSNLRGADLSRAILKQTQLDGTDLTRSILTGAYIEDWGITSTTKLENVQCEYVYMRVPTKENPNPLRKPDNLRETFAEGEFADFIQPFFDTLDLYHSQDVDPRAISIALRDLSANHPDDNLQFMAIERRGNNGINLRFTATPRANKSELSHEYFANYAQIKKELPAAVQMKLAEQDVEIRTLKGTIEQFIQIGVHQTPNQALPVKSILLLAANPKGTATLRLDEEVRELQKGLERSRYRDQFSLQQRWAVTSTDVRRALLDLKPAIVHFSGHGVGIESNPNQAPEDARKLTFVGTSDTAPEGLMWENEVGQPQLVSTEGLADLFGLFTQHLECVVLNACFSEVQAEAIARHIPYVIGMKRAIGDQAAIKFAIGFYDGLLAGESIEFAYRLGCNAIQTAGIPEHLTPVLKQRSN